MSVLKNKRTQSKAEYVNTANQIYIKTVDFLSRLSARYSRLLAVQIAELAGSLMDNMEEANSIYPSNPHPERPATAAPPGGAGRASCPGREVDTLLLDHVPKPARVLYR